VRREILPERLSQAPCVIGLDLEIPGYDSCHGIDFHKVSQVVFIHGGRVVDLVGKAVESAGKIA
jgi:hypothetical protein